MPRDVELLVRDIHDAFEVPLEEVDLYVRAVVSGRIQPMEARGKELAESLLARGMLILDSNDKSYLPVHPRMALSNLFRTYEETWLRKRKEKRLLVDRLTLELIPLVPSVESKGTNARGPEGAGSTTG